MCQELDHVVCVHYVKKTFLDKSFNPHCTEEDTKQLGNTQVPTATK